MDNHERKRREAIARVLAETAIIIQMVLANLDDISLYRHTGPDARERIAEDLTMVHRNIIPNVAAPPEILALVRAILLDWVILNDLVSLAQVTGVTGRLLDTMDEVATRLVLSMDALRDMVPGLYEDRE